MLGFDIETGRLAKETVMAQFDPDSVKYGNVKDEAKRAAIDKYAANQWWETAALRPTTGGVVAIGYAPPNGPPQVAGIGHNFKLEVELLDHFWQTFAWCVESNVPMVGWNTHNFDLPFLIKRSWIVGSEVPGSAMQSGRRYFSDTFIDLMKVWCVGQFGANQFAKLDFVCRALDLGEKTPLNGADFHGVWENSRQEAIEYLEQDVTLLLEVAERMKI